jgi:hypothetical protein
MPLHAMNPLRLSILGLVGIALHTGAVPEVFRLRLPTASASSFVLLSESGEAFASKILQTDTGIALVRSVLGNKAARLTPALEREFYNTLMHPGNDDLAEFVASKVIGIEGDLSLLRRKPKYKQATPEVRLQMEAALIRSESARWLSLTGEGSSGRIRFVSGEEFALKTSYAIHRQEFLMGGESRSLKRAYIADTTRLPDPPVGSGVKRNAFDQLWRWEEQANLRTYRETTQTIALPVARVSISDVDIQMASSLPAQVKDLFLHGDATLMWPKHPYNQAVEAPFHENPAVEQWAARFTSSRSMVVQDPATGVAFSVKAPTNYPHRTEFQGEKVDLSGDVKFSVYRTNHIDAIDRRMGQDSTLILLKEIFAASDQATGNGFVVRDLSPLQDGNYYFPALSIPYEGRMIAKQNGQNFVDFWGKNYAELLGRAKARLLIRYGLQMETPNCQNMLIQLDRNLKPTGKLVFRDISDSDMVVGVARGMGADDILDTDHMLGYRPKQDILPETWNSLWRLDEAGVSSVPRDELVNWAAFHDVAYVNEIQLMLSPFDPTIMRVHSIGALNSYLKTESAARALQALHGISN